MAPGAPPPARPGSTAEDVEVEEITALLRDARYEGGHGPRVPDALVSRRWDGEEESYGVFLPLFLGLILFLNAFVVLTMTPRLGAAFVAVHAVTVAVIAAMLVWRWRLQRRSPLGHAFPRLREMLSRDWKAPARVMDDPPPGGPAPQT